MFNRKRQDYVYVKAEQQSTSQETKHHLRHENKTNEIRCYHIVSHKNICKTYVQTLLKAMKMLFFIVSNLQTHYHFKLDFQNWTNIQEASGQSMAPNTARTISCKAWNSLVKYYSRESKHDIKESEGNMFNPIFKEKVLGLKHSGICIFAESKLRGFRKPECTGQN